MEVVETVLQELETFINVEVSNVLCVFDHALVEIHKWNLGEIIEGLGLINFLKSVEWECFNTMNLRIVIKNDYILNYPC